MADRRPHGRNRPRKTWSDPARVNDETTSAWQWFGTMSVGDGGRIDIVWNDSRDAEIESQSELYYTFSKDGGQKWAPKQRLKPGLG